MSRILIALLALVTGFIASAGLSPEAVAQKRLAFVAGTDKYDNLGRDKQLQRAVNDARTVAASFKALGFDVLALENVARGQFNNEWQKFLDKLNAGDTAAIYYAGHGVEIEGLNFLLPRDIPDIKFGRQEQIKRESISVAELLLDLRTRNPEIALIVLDACRDNPLIPDEMRSAGTVNRGLAPLKGEPPKGTFIIYSAGAGESALDRLPGNDPDKINSIFTRKLLPLLGTKGLALHDLARQLRADVLQLASTVPHTQRPAYYDGVIGRYCLAGCDGGQTQEQRISEAATTWEKLRASTSVADLEAYAARYQDLYFAGLAKSRIEELKKQAQTAAVATKTTATPKAPLTSSETSTTITNAAQSAWVKLCENASVGDPPKPVNICLTHHERLDAVSGMVLVSAAIRQVEGQADQHFMVMVPLGMQQGPGMRAYIYPKDKWAAVEKDPQTADGSAKVVSLPYSMCHAAGCTGEVEAKPDFINDLKKAGGMVVYAINPSGAPVGFPITLAGFDQAYTGAPVDNKVYAEARRKLMQELAARQREALKELEAKHTKQ